MKHNKLSLTTEYIIVVCALLLVISVVLGAVLMMQSANAMKTMTRMHMSSVSETVAAMVDGDMLEGITIEKIHSPEYKQIADTLTAVKNAQKNKDLKYIYLVKREDDHYVFTIDPDPETPATFGARVVDAPGQDPAWAGETTVDDKPYEDAWGCYYSAWSPVRNSGGVVVGMVGVDFAADWYDQQISNHKGTVLIASSVSLLAGVLIMLLLTGQLRRRFRKINGELSELSEDLDQLASEIKGRPGYEEKDAEPGTGGEDIVGALNARIRAMQKKLRAYIRYMQEQAYRDSMTGTSNKTAYLERIRELDQEIANGTAAFAVAVFDVNSLKGTNDNYGHDCGDCVLIDAANVIKTVFGSKQVYRIGGDEFIVLLGDVTEEELNAKLEQADEKTGQFNRENKKYDAPMSFSAGGAVYRPGKDPDFKAVFKRADLAMYEKKDAFYRVHADPRRQHDEQAQ